MNHKTDLKVQAWLDAELSDREAAEVERLVAEDAEAGRLLAELRWTRESLRAGEVDRPVPETREFYWSKIERAIHTAGAGTPDRATPAWSRWLRILLPIGAAAGLALFFALPSLRPDSGAAEIENHLDDTGSFSFRSESERMTVIWIASN
jgi:hypothetical protein